MTYKETVEKYREVFIMLVEKAGRETGNTSYLRIDEILKSESVEKTLEESFYPQEPDFVIIVCFFMITLFCDIYGVEKVEEWNTKISGDKISEFYELFLRKATIKFCQKYGLPAFDDPETSFKLVKVG